MQISEPLIAAVAVAVVLTSIWTIRRAFSNRRAELHLAQIAERRRAHRVSLATPVFVYGWAGNEPFSENTKTLDVSARGGLMLLSTKVAPSQKLLLSNAGSTEDLPCRVVRSAKTPAGALAVGFEFLRSSPNFWQIEFVSGTEKSPTAPDGGENLRVSSRAPYG